MAAAFVVRLSDSFPRSASFGGANTAVVWAEDATAAREAAASYFDGDSNASWTNAATTVTPVIVSDTLTFSELSLNITVATVGNVLLEDVTVSGGLISNTLDLIAADMIVALNATATISNASYDSNTNIITVAGAADGIGHHRLGHKWFRTVDPGLKAIAVLAGVETELGAPGDALKIAFPADNVVLPQAGWADFGISIVVANPTTHVAIANVAVEGGASADAIDDFGVLLVTAINNTPIDAASYNASTNLLTVAAAGDLVGDHVVTAKAYRKADARKQEIPHLIGAITDEGAVDAPLTIQLVTDALNVPKVYATVKV